MKKLIFVVLHCIINHQSNNAQSYKQHIEPQYPSYIGRNNFGYCLRASQDLAPNTVVGTNKYKPTKKSYIAHANSKKRSHITLVGVDINNKPKWGIARGKGGYVNHSCQPNCIMHDNAVVTLLPVRKDEELTIAYDTKIYTIPWMPEWNFICKCASPRCKKIIKEYKQ